MSSQGETVVPVSEDGHAARSGHRVARQPAPRTRRDELAGRFDRETVYAATGVPAIVPTWTACKLLWWKRHDPALFAHARRFLLVEDFLLHRLTGRFVTEGGVQCTSLLYDIGRHTGGTRCSTCSRSTPDRLADLARPGDVVGTLRPRSRRGARPAGVPCASCGRHGPGRGGGRRRQRGPGRGLGEHRRRADAAGVRRPPGGDPTGETPVYVHSAPGRYLYCPVCPTGGMTLTWFRDRFGQARWSAPPAGRSAYDLLTDLAPRRSRGLRRAGHAAAPVGRLQPRVRARGPWRVLRLHARPRARALRPRHPRGGRVHAAPQPGAARRAGARGERRSARTAAGAAARSGTRSRPMSAGCRSSRSTAARRPSAATPCSRASRPGRSRASTRPAGWPSRGATVRARTGDARRVRGAYRRYRDLFDAVRPLFAGPTRRRTAVPASS